MNAKNKERQWLLIWSAFLIVLTTVPILIGFDLARGTSFQFSGFLFGVEDGNSYIAKMLSGSAGDWLFRTPYSAYPQNGFLAFLPYYLLGKLAHTPELHLQLISIFQIFRWVGILFLITETYRFAKIFIPSSNLAKIAVIISSVGGGLGWLVILFYGRLPLEFYSPEAFGFLSIFGLPHLLFARGLMLRAFRMLLQPGIDIFQLDRRVSAGIYLLLAGFFQPLIIPLAWMIIFAWKLAEFLKFRKILLMVTIKENLFFFLIPFPFFAYNTYMFIFDPYLSAWEGQNIIKSPPPIDFLWAYGIGFLCLVFVMWKWRSEIQRKIFLLSWAILLPVLVYFPINLQRRLSDGYWVILSIFISIIIGKIKKPTWRNLVIVFTCLSTIFLYSGSLLSVTNLHQPIYQPLSVIETVQAIGEDCEKKDVVLAPYDISNVLPAYIPVRVITGHGPESKNLDQIQKFVTQFFDQENLSSNDQFLKQFWVRYIIFPKSYEIDSESWWYRNSELLFENNDYRVFKLLLAGEF